MKIVYNPKDGAPITKYIYLGTLVDPHYPDGYELNGVKYNGLMQYEDDIADAICENFTFLEKINNDQAKNIIDRPPDPEYVCDFPGCDFKASYKVALMGHKRSHKQGQTEKPVFDDTKIPVNQGKKVSSNGQNRSLDEKLGPELKSGLDEDGVEWYGEGVTTDFANVPVVGKGHFT